MNDKKKPKPPPSPSDDLPPRGNLPEKSVIPPGKGFGDDIPRKKEEKPKMRSGGVSKLKVIKPKRTPKFGPQYGMKKFASGGSVKSSASKRADGIAMKGKTRGKFV